MYYTSTILSPARFCALYTPDIQLYRRSDHGGICRSHTASRFKLKNRLDRLSKAIQRSRSFVAAEAIREYVTLNAMANREVTKALGEADRGEFASAQTSSGLSKSGPGVRVRWLARALAKLNAEAEYIARDKPRCGPHGSNHSPIGRPAPAASRSGPPRNGRRHAGTGVPGTPYIVPYRIRNNIHLVRDFMAPARCHPSCNDNPKTPLDTVPDIHSHPQLFHSS